MLRTNAAHGLRALAEPTAGSCCSTAARGRACLRTNHHNVLSSALSLTRTPSWHVRGPAGRHGSRHSERRVILVRTVSFWSLSASHTRADLVGVRSSRLLAILCRSSAGMISRSLVARARCARSALALRSLAESDATPRVDTRQARWLARRCRCCSAWSRRTCCSRSFMPSLSLRRRLARRLRSPAALLTRPVAPLRRRVAALVAPLNRPRPATRPMPVP